MLSFKQFYLLEGTDAELASIKQWREQALQVFKKLNSLDDIMQAFLGNNHKNYKEYLKIERIGAELMQSISNIAYSKYKRFHELEYKLHLLKTQYNRDNVSQLINFTEYELLKLYNWLEVVIRTVLDSRTAIQRQAQKNRKYIQKYFTVDPNSEVWKRSWDSIYASYAILDHAKTLEDKIKAITLTLNAAHDNGNLFISSVDAKDQENWRDGTWCYGPFTNQQYDSLNYIDKNKVMRELRKEVI